MSTPPFAENDEETTLPSSPLPTVFPDSPLNSLPNEVRSVLDEFRDNWQRELKEQNENAISDLSGQQLESDEQISDNTTLSQPSENADPSEIAQQKLAEKLFRKAVELEQRGKVYDALPLYRKAIQIVPDIEFKFNELQMLKVSTNTETNTGENEKAISNEDSVDEEFIADLYEKFQIDLAQDYGGKLLQSNQDASVITTDLHISNLPPEMLLYILRWVVSAQLDLRSLEQCAAVCKGLYLCARDEDIWRLACIKVWGRNVGTLSNPATGVSDDIESSEDINLPLYTSWRQMFIERERLLFNGCYISKTTYLRMGENSFQDQYYRPVQLVEYYRYFRFLPDGTVLMMTNADEPSQGVTKLRNLQQIRSDVLRGHYHLYGSTVSIILKKQNISDQRIINNVRHKRGNSANSDELNCTKYCIEFRIMSSPKRNFAQLVWLHYSILLTRNKVENSTELNLTPSKYPTLWFSPVRSYHLDSDAPLA